MRSVSGRIPSSWVIASASSCSSIAFSRSPIPEALEGSSRSMSTLGGGVKRPGVLTVGVEAESRTGKFQSLLPRLILKRLVGLIE